MNTKIIPLATRRKPREIKASAYQIYLNSMASTGRPAMVTQLKIAAQLLGFSQPAKQYPWHELNFEKVHTVRAAMQDLEYAVSTINLTLACLRGVAKTAFNLEQLGGDELLRIQAVKNVKGSITRTGRSVSRIEIKKLLRAAKNIQDPVRASRETALLLLGFGTGLRALEICSLEVADFNQKNALLTIKQGKGRKKREIYLAKEVTKSLHAWLKQRGIAEGALFTRIPRPGVINYSGLSTRGLANLVTRVQQQANIDKFSLHDIRRSFITHLLEQGTDINIVRQLAGHSDVSTTTRYDRRDITWQKKASQNITFI
ncbi:MAG: site-specific integrase [Cellvibrionaceae bacterium]